MIVLMEKVHESYVFLLNKDRKEAVVLLGEL